MTPEELLEALDSVAFKFWVCPNHQKAEVTWKGKIASCKVCGLRSDQQQY